jgi:hypothetical protein
MGLSPECTMENMLKPIREAGMEPDAIDPTGGPAFPRAMCDAGDPHGIVDPGAEGMRLRDWFAGQALAGLIASNTYSNGADGFEAFIADKALNIADAMLAARIEKENADG